MTLTCAETESHLVDVVDGRLGPPLEMRVHAHLEGCAACQQKAELWRKLVPGMRGLAPSPPAELGARRLEVEVLRQLQSAGVTRTRAPRRWVAVAAVAASLSAAAALVALAARARAEARRRARAPPTGYAHVTRIVGAVTSGRARAGGRDVAGGRRRDLRWRRRARRTCGMDRGSVMRLSRPGPPRRSGARRVTSGSASQAGTLEAEVAHRLAGETFAVSTARRARRGPWHPLRRRDGAGGSSVRVSRGAGRGAARRRTRQPHRRRGRVDHDRAAPAARRDGPPARATAPTRRRTARARRAVVRAGGAQLPGHGARGAPEHARRRQRPRAPPGDRREPRRARQRRRRATRELIACEDELRYLRAEALRGAGRFDDAVAAYKALNRAGAPAAMRQNALYAAAELERRKGRTRDGRRGLRERARRPLPGARCTRRRWSAAWRAPTRPANAGAPPRFARRYLAEFPSGRAARRRASVVGRRRRARDENGGPRRE